jgi:MFS family permease
MLLDFLATFFASAVMLLPIYADEILQVGELEYGLLWAAPAIGAVIMTYILAKAGNFRHQGVLLLWSVAIFGLATIVFGLSRNFWLSMLALGVTGASDTVSAMIRNLIRQLKTPDAMRGRMTGINMMFYMGGPQLGEFEAGLLARATSAPFSVVFGGVVTLGVVIGAALRWPFLREFENYASEKAPAAAQALPQSAAD